MPGGGYIAGGLKIMAPDTGLKWPAYGCAAEEAAAAEDI